LTRTAFGNSIFDVKTTYSISKGQSQFPALVRAAQRRGVATVTKHDEAVAYVVSREKWEALLETMELLASPDFHQQWQRLRAGKVKYRSLEELAAG
jgi:prevent-host-death family protein